MKRPLGVALGGLLALGLLAWALLPRLFAPPVVESAEVRAAVMVSKPRLGPIERTLLYSGTLKPKRTITLTSKVPGRVLSILVEEGQLVARDQPLARIEDEVVRLQMQQAQAAWQAAEAQLEQARRGVRAEELNNARALHEKALGDLEIAEDGFRRSEALFRSGAISRSQHESAESALRGARTEVDNAGRTLAMLEQGAGPEEQEMARAQARAARAQYELARLQVDYTEVRAPEAGIVARLLTDPGNSVDAAVPILVLVQDDPLLAEVAVPERHYGEVLERRESIECRLRPAAYPGARAFAGAISAVAPTVSPGSRTFTVTIEVPNPQRRLRPGMYAELELVMERREAVLLVPESAVLERHGGRVVFVVRGPGPSDVAAADRGPHGSAGTDEARGVARERSVDVGLADQGFVEIRQGISSQDRVIVEGNLFLEDGQPIVILESR